MLHSNTSLTNKRVYMWLIFPLVPVPNCADIRGTIPSAWTANQLSRMPQEDLRLCMDVIGQDRSLSPEQRRSLWLKVRQVGGVYSVQPFSQNRPVTNRSFLFKPYNCMFFQPRIGLTLFTLVELTNILTGPLILKPLWLDTPHPT